MPDEDIDTPDIPEVLDWTGAIRGGLYCTRKEAITIRFHVAEKEKQQG